MQKGKFLFQAALLAAVWLFAHDSKPWPVPKEASDLKNPAASTPASLKEAKALYEKECAVCHGPKGDGKGAGAVALQVRPADFTDSPMMDGMTDGDLFYKLSEGRMPMAAYKGKLSEEQRWKLVSYLRTFNKKDAGKKSVHKH
jgi:mono/diheme cytochrome c family protein